MSDNYSNDNNDNRIDASVTEPLISLIIPYYNGGEYIDRAIAAAKEISCPKEILVINDGSPDGSFSKVEEKWKGDAEVRLFIKENGGVVSARNFGVEHARGKYLAFSDQDDIPIGSVITEAVQKAEEVKAQVLLWSTVETYKEKRTDKSCDSILCEGLVRTEDIKNVILKQILTNSSSEYANQIRHLWMGLYEKSFVVENGISFKRFVTYEDDFLFLIDVMARAERLYFLKNVGYKWFMNRSSESHVTKPILNYMDKTTKLYSYCEEVMKVAGYDDDVKEDIMRFCRQKQVSFALLEYAKLPGNADKVSEKKKIKKALEVAYDTNSFDKNRLSGDRRKLATYRLLEKKHVAMAFLYNKFYNRYFEFKKLVGSIIWRNYKQK